jgi:hypothetical protein
MSTKKITQLTAATSMLTTDIIPIVTAPGGAAETKQITLANLLFSLAWTNYAPTVTGSGGTIGTFAASPYTGRYLLLGHLCFVTNVIKITNLGSWSGVIQIALPLAPSASILSDMTGMGYLAANASNPVTASKGFPLLTGGDINYRFINSIDAAYTMSG